MKTIDMNVTNLHQKLYAFRNEIKVYQRQKEMLAFQPTNPELWRSFRRLGVLLEEILLLVDVEQQVVEQLYTNFERRKFTNVLKQMERYNPPSPRWSQRHRLNPRIGRVYEYGTRRAV